MTTLLEPAGMMGRAVLDRHPQYVISLNTVFSYRRHLTRQREDKSLVNVENMWTEVAVVGRVRGTARSTEPRRLPV
jgi:hypothetical protein